MRTQGWWLNVAKRRDVLTPYEIANNTGFEHYCSIWLGDTRGGAKEIEKARNICDMMQASEEGEKFQFTLAEEWITGTRYEQGAW